MAASTSKVKIGIIAEDDNDVEVMLELTRKFVPRNRFSHRKFVGHGCGMVQRKCASWSTILLKSGCSHLVVVHDQDRRNAGEAEELGRLLQGKTSRFPADNRLIIIPVEEIEAWLLADPEAIKDVFNMRSLPRIPQWPETIRDPKDFLMSTVRKNSETRYLNTVHNKRIARALSISKLSRCPSFSKYPKFMASVFGLDSGSPVTVDGLELRTVRPVRKGASA